MMNTFFAKLLHGRNGFDGFSRFLIVAALVLMIAEMIAGSGVVGTILRIISWAFLLYACFRVFSTNVPARQRELIRYNIFVRELRFRWGRAKSFIIHHQPQDVINYKYFACPACGQKLRVPRGKGKINIRCSRCGERFLSRS